MTNTYTDEEKREALLLYVDRGPAEAARQTGISPLTISSWARRSGVHTNAPVKTKEATEMLVAKQESMREELRVRMLAKALDLVDRMDAPHVEFKGKDAAQVSYPVAPAAAVQNYATSIAILLDKYRLEVGEATSRNESRDLTHDDHEREALRDAIRSELTRRHRDREAESSPELGGAVEASAPAEAGAT